MQAGSFSAAACQLELLVSTVSHGSNQRSTVTVPMAGLIMVNDIRVVRSMALAGEGVALLPVCLCREACAEKLLVPVLPEWHSRSDPIHLVYPHQRFIPPKLRVFVDLAVPELRQWLAVF